MSQPLRVAPSNAASCSDCGDLLDTTQAGTGEWVTGISVQRPHGWGGVNQLASYERLGKFVCRPCMARRRSGVHPSQGRLL